ncbi:MAG: endonuclease/exonuclease/phosphatase family protein [Theionarchaea archaeon]|nr:endonuclease/exonuclease/phosphatase family protein [Theionarchaea archaeon]
METSIEKKDAPSCRFMAKCKARSDVLLFVLIMLAVLFFLETSRELLGATYNMNLTTFSINSSVIVILLFFSPVLFFFKPQPLRIPLLMAGAGLLLGLARLLMACSLPVESYLVCNAIAVGSGGIFFTALILESRNHFTSLEAALAAASGVSIDVVSRILGNTFAVTLYGVTAHDTVSAVLTVVLVALFLLALAGWYCIARVSPSKEEPSQFRLSSGVFLGFGMGALAFLVVGFLLYPNTVARWVGGNYTEIAALEAAALAAFLAVSLTPYRKHLLTNHALTLGGLLIGIAALSMAYLSAPLVVAGLTALGVFFLPAQVEGIVRHFSQKKATSKQIALVMLLGAFVFVILIFLSVFSLTWAFVGLSFLRDQGRTIILCAVLLFLIFTTIPRYGHLKFEPFAAPTNPFFVASIAVLVLIGGLAGAFGYTVAPPSSQEGTLTVMTYNLHQGYSMDGRIDPWQILEPIQDVSPDILVLQESDMNRVSSTNVDIVQWLSCQLDMYYYFGPSTGDQIYGVSILSRFPLSNMVTYFMPSIEDQRVLVRADIQWSSATLSIYAVHMGLSEEDRTAQIAFILNILNQNKNPALLMGDTNSVPDSPQIVKITCELKDAWVAAGNSPLDPAGNTFDSLELNKRIDYILISPHLRAASCHVVRGVYGSDHIPVWAEITWE